MSTKEFDLVVIGSGFAGSLFAMMAHRLGLETILIERGKHPRFVIGESTTPLSNLLLQEIAAEYDLGFLGRLAKWGTWQKSTPQIACGLKRGFTFYQHQPGRRFEPDPNRCRQLLVGASPDETVADTHWYRPEFDQYLVEQAQKLGVTYWDQTELLTLNESSEAVFLAGKRQNAPFQVKAKFVVDASGARGFLHRALGLGQRQLPNFPPTQGLFSHFTGVGPLPESFGAEHDLLPYPPEQAAVHHVFPGGWVWVLKFNNGITSAGVAATDPLAARFELASGEKAWRRLLDWLPSLGDIFSRAHAVVPFVYQPRVAFATNVVAGSRWALLPSAAGVVDPLLSTGFPLTLLGVKRLGHILRQHWEQDSLKTELEAYSRQTRDELDATARLVSALYHSMDRFELFKDISLLYFAAASFSENARRLGRAHLADSFLLCRNQQFSAQMKEFCHLAMHSLSTEMEADVRRQIRAAIEPFDVIGLTDASRHPWYPALSSDLYRTASKLGATENEIARMLQGEAD